MGSWWKDRAWQLVLLLVAIVLIQLLVCGLPLKSDKQRSIQAVFTAFSPGPRLSIEYDDPEQIDRLIIEPLRKSILVKNDQLRAQIGWLTVFDGTEEMHLTLFLPWGCYKKADDNNFYQADFSALARSLKAVHQTHASDFQ